MRRWDPWNVILAVGLAGFVYALERLLTVASDDALVDASLTGFVGFVVLTWWRG